MLNFSFKVGERLQPWLNTEKVKSDLKQKTGPVYFVNI